MSIKNTLFLCLILFAISSFGQSENEALYLKKNTTFEIEVASSGLKINEHHYSDKIFYRNFEKHSRESVFYSDFDPVTSLEAQTTTPANKKVKVTTIETKDIVQPGIFYGGYKRKEFVFPGITEGSIGHLEFTKEITDAHLLTPFFFGDDVNVKQAEFSVIFPPELNLNYKVFCDPGGKIKFEKQAIKNKVKYSWTLTDVPAYKPERNSPARSYSAPHVVVYIDSYQHRGKTTKVLSDVSDLYNWYGSLVKNIPAIDSDDALKDQVMTLTKGLTSAKEKTRAIFQWVQSNIKYIAFEDGMAGFVPRSAKDVYVKRYGDCKDMANLLKYMLNIAGVDAYLTWIGTRSKPYSYSDVPTAIADNHMICSVRMDGQFVFLDATNSFVSFGKPSSMIQGKEALVGLNDRQFEVVKVPVISRNQNQRIDTIRMSLEGTGVKGTVTGVLSGYKKDDLEVASLRASINQDREFVRDFFSIGNDDITIENTIIQGLGNPNLSGNVKFKFFQPGYFKRAGDKLYLNLNVNKTLPGDRIDIKTREQNIEMDYCYEDRSLIVFDIPEHHTVTFIPSDLQKSWPEFGFSTTYKQQAGKIILERSVYSNYLYLDKSKFEQWNEFINGLTSSNAQTIILAKSN
jgi:hypothetical protein